LIAETAHAGVVSCLQFKVHMLLRLLLCGRRFYFLSNEELLDILRQAKVPQAVQPHLAKCFDGIQHLEFAAPGPEAHLPSKDILAMVSAEGERVAFGRTLKVRSSTCCALSGFHCQA